MQPDRHPEALERKQHQLSESPPTLSKMTKHEQEAGVALSRCESILEHLLIPVIPQIEIVRRPEPGCGDPGRNGRFNGGKLRWDWGRLFR